MKIDILLNKANRKTLVKMCKRLFPEFQVKLRKKTVTFKRRWYSLDKERMSVVDLVLLHIPAQINRLYVENDLREPFEEINDLHSAVGYFGVKSIGQDFIQFLAYRLTDMDLSIAVNQGYTAEPISLEVQEEIVEETYATEKVFMETLEYFYNTITDIVNRIQPTMKIVYINTESARDSPRIRSPGMANVA